MGVVLVHAEIHGLAGRAGELRSLLTEHAAATVRMDGCAGAVALEPLGAEPGEFVLDVWWEDDGAMRAHYGSGEYARYTGLVGELLARPSDVHVHYVDHSVHATGDPSSDPTR